MLREDYEKIPDRQRAEELFEKAQVRKNQEEKEAKLQFDLALHYRYFRFYPPDVWTTSVEVAISVGWKIIKVNNKELVSYAIALQSKKDTFSRKEARKHINDRWEKGLVAYFELPSGIKRNVDTLIAWHYNSHTMLPTEYGLRGNVPKYLWRIPIYFG